MDPKQTPRQLTTITVTDDRGTKFEVTLYIAGPMLTDYIKEAMMLWADQWEGRADHVFVSQPGGSFEWIKPGNMKEQEPHTP